MAIAGVADTEFTTKLLVPRRRKDIIRRQRLIDLLHNNIHLRLQVASAPAGYGKTTLLVDFVNDLDIPVCWYSLGTEDQDPRLFLEGILASIRFRFHDFRNTVPGGSGNSRPRVQAPNLPGCHGRNFAMRTPKRTARIASR